MDFNDIVFRKAEEKDLQYIITMLADDFLGKNREEIKNFDKYKKVFAEISNDKNNFVAVLEFDNEVIATAHLTIMNSLTRSASKRMNIEAVRVSGKYQNKGLGTFLMKKAIDFAKINDVKIIQLTSDIRRKDAHRFYEKLSFQASHLGMKLYL